MTEKNLIKLETVEDKIIDIRGEKVILDSYVAALYGVETRDINKAAKNNPDKFPEGYIIKLTAEEKNELVKNFHRFNKIKHSNADLKAFTEKGLYMLATIIKSPKAVRTMLDIIETYARIKDLSMSISKLPKASEAEQKNILEKASEVIGDILFNADEELDVTDSETTYEANLGFIKIKKTVKKGK